jgi:hypothetical protein
MVRPPSAGWRLGAASTECRNSPQSGAPPWCTANRRVRCVCVSLTPTAPVCPLAAPPRPNHATQIHFFLLFSRQGKVRLSKYYSTFTQKERAKARVVQ